MVCFFIPNGPDHERQLKRNACLLTPDHGPCFGWTKRYAFNKVQTTSDKSWSKEIIFYLLPAAGVRSMCRRRTAAKCSLSAVAVATPTTLRRPSPVSKLVEVICLVQVGEVALGNGSMDIQSLHSYANDSTAPIRWTMRERRLRHAPLPPLHRKWMSAVVQARSLLPVFIRLP